MPPCRPAATFFLFALAARIQTFKYSKINKIQTTLFPIRRCNRSWPYVVSYAYDQIMKYTHQSTSTYARHTYLVLFNRVSTYQVRRMMYDVIRNDKYWHYYTRYGIPGVHIRGRMGGVVEQHVYFGTWWTAGGRSSLLFEKMVVTHFVYSWHRLIMSDCVGVTVIKSYIRIVYRTHLST